MTTTPPDTSQPQGPAPDSGPRVGWDDIRDLARIRRSRSNRRVAGVAGGLGRHLDIDPVILRVAFVVLTFFGGVGLLLYVALWLLLPEDGKDWARIRLDRRSRSVALVIVGVLAVLLLVSHGWWGHGGLFLVWLLVIAAAVVIATQLPRRDREAASTPPPATPPASTPPAWTPPASYAVQPGPEQPRPEQPRPVNPRKRGPILFWFALAVMSVALGALGIADLAGADVAPSAYPATVLGLSAVFLLVGSFFGRAGGIILVGLLAAAVTVGSTVADQWHPRRTTVRPVTASAVLGTYRMDVGELVVDLTGLRDASTLDGRTIHVDGNVGHIEIRVPADLTVVANADVTGVGGVHAFGVDDGGADTTITSTHDAGPGAPRLTIDSQLHVGAIDVIAEGATP